MIAGRPLSGGRFLVHLNLGRLGPGSVIYAILSHMTSAELISAFKTERPFFDTLHDLQEALLFGSALQEKELSADVDLLLVPARELSEGEKIDMRQAVWTHFKDRLPVMLEVVTPTEEVSKEALASKGVPTESVYVK